MVAVGSDLWESDSSARRFAEAGAYPWLTVLAARETILDYGVSAQSSAVGLDAGGIIVFRKGYGTTSAQAWTAVLEQLAAGT